MEKVFKLTILISFFFIKGFSQNCDIPLNVIVPSQVEALDATSESQIKNKLRHIAVQNGIGGGDFSPFALTVSLDVLNKEIIPGSTTKYAYVFNVNLFIVDTQDQKIYTSTSSEVRSIGNIKTKAYVAAIKKISPKNQDIQAFVATGRQKMMDYYNRNYSTIIKRAKSYATLRDYEKALFFLMSIPECCDGYDVVLAEVQSIYKQFVDYKCASNLAQAQAAWASGFTRENASVAGVFLSEIYPDAACYADAQELFKEIKKHMGKEWDFKLKQWDDRVSIEMQQLKHMREIALAYAQNQPKENVDIIFR